MMLARLRPLARLMSSGIPADRLGFAANCGALLVLTLALATLDLLLLPLAHLTVAADGLDCLNVVAAAILVPVAAIYLLLRFDEKMASMTTASAAVILATPVLCLLTYIAVALGRERPLCDRALARFDEALGFDWPAMMTWFDAHPFLTELGRYAYMSLPEQTAVAVLALTFFGRTERLQTTILAFMVGAALCTAGSAVFPALGTYVFYQIDPSQHVHIDLMTRDQHVADVLALRAGTFASFSIDAAKGIITFPSFHTTLGILFSWAFWPLRCLRWPALALNAVLVAATPLQGSHYLADVLAGAAVACIAIGAAAALHGAVATAVFRGGTAPSIKGFRAA